MLRRMTLSSQLALAMVSLVLATTAVLSLLTYHTVSSASLPRALDRLATKATVIASDLQTMLNGARQDALMIQSGVGVVQLVAANAAADATGADDGLIREGIAVRFASILQAKPEYTQLRIIGVDVHTTGHRGGTVPCGRCTCGRLRPLLETRGRNEPTINDALDRHPARNC